MNQQRSRRFRSAQEAKEKEEQRKEGIAMYEGEVLTLVHIYAMHCSFVPHRTAMGIKVSDETKNQKSWDSNAITPGTCYYP
jgi:5'-3' exoribonuclease 2